MSKGGKFAGVQTQVGDGGIGSEIVVTCGIEIFDSIVPLHVQETVHAMWTGVAGLDSDRSDPVKKVCGILDCL
jgi:hypothetical protein